MFVPAYGAFRQGIVLTIPLQLRLLAPGVDATRLHACLTQHYSDTNHVQVLSMQAAKELTYLDPQALNGTDDVRLIVCENHETGQVLLAAVFDNLGKGAAGAAVQNLDLMIKHRP
jgi:N-acetyl-gamma-glutamyl-phosphate reductase